MECQLVVDVPILKRKFYRTVIRPIMLYRFEFRAVKRQYIQKNERSKDVNA